MRDSLNYISKHKFLLLIIIPAFLLYMFIVFPSGTYFCFEKECGYYFWGVHGRDAIWHLAIEAVSFKKIPFISPTFAGENLYSYNWLMDFGLFLLSKMGIPAIISYFKLLPVVWFIVFTSLLTTFARKVRNNPVFVGLFLLMSYFAGSFSYLLTLYHSKTIKDSSTLLVQPILHSMSNLQYALSLLFFLALLILIKDRKISLKQVLASGIVLFCMFGLKFYGGLMGLFLVSIDLLLKFFQNLQREKMRTFFTYVFYFLLLAIFVSFSVLIFYNPFQSGKTGFPFGFAPFALVHPITEAPDQFYLQGMTDARYYLQQFRMGPRLFAIESLNLFIFLFFYLGTRFFGIIYIAILGVRRKLDTFDTVVVSTIFFSILLTVTLVQKGVWWNTIQFFFYAIFLSTLYLTKLVQDLFSAKQKLFHTLAVVVILLSLPTSYDLFWHFVNSRPTYIPQEEIEALNFLKKQPQGVVLDEQFKMNTAAYAGKNFPLYGYGDSSHVAVLSGQQQYIADVQTLGVSSVPYEKRLERVREMDCTILKEVDYVYEVKLLPKSKKIIPVCKPKQVKNIFENSLIRIYSLH